MQKMVEGPCNPWARTDWPQVIEGPSAIDVERLINRHIRFE